MLEEKISCQLKLRSSTTTTTTIKPFIPKQVRVGKRGNHMSQKKKGQQERKRRGKTKGEKKPNRKRRRGNKTLSQKSEKGQKKNLTKWQ
jgi:hypothetical protein